MKPTFVLLMVIGTALISCDRDSTHPAVPKLVRNPLLIHSPPVDRLTAQQLRSLSMACEKFAPDPPARGPYDAVYCEDAIAAWSDSPLQIVILDGAPVKVAPATQPAKVP